MKSLWKLWAAGTCCHTLPDPLSPPHDLLVSIHGTHGPSEVPAQAQIHGAQQIFVVRWPLKMDFHISPLTGS